MKKVRSKTEVEFGNVIVVQTDNKKNHMGKVVDWIEPEGHQPGGFIIDTINGLLCITKEEAERSLVLEGAL